MKSPLRVAELLAGIVIGFNLGLILLWLAGVK
jgi:hypothetical protein